VTGKKKIQTKAYVQSPNAPIGIFDSGVGGLTVMRAVHTLMPNERLIYFGDTARIPYGPKSKTTIIRYSRQIVNFLLSRKVKMIIVACNTATSYALATLRRITDIPIIGVIDPVAAKAAKMTKNGRVGVIGTSGTIGSHKYVDALRKYDKSIRVYQEETGLFVPLVEEGWTRHPVVRMIINEYLLPLRKRKIDTLILGCTHYPLLRNGISAVMGTVRLLESGAATADAAQTILVRKGLRSLRTAVPSVQIYASDVSPVFRNLAQTIMGDDHTIIHLKVME